MNVKAIDKAARRKANRKLRSMGVDSVKFNLNGAQVRAERKFHKLEVLNDKISTGDTNERIAAAKAKRAMNVDWQDRGVASPKEYHKADQTFQPIVLDIKKRYLRSV